MASFDSIRREHERQPSTGWRYVLRWLRRQLPTGLYTRSLLIIIIPMVIMAFVPGRTSSVATVIICTLLFAVGAAYFSPTKPPLELMITTAAYAAVLVVFVGASITDVTGHPQGTSSEE